MKIKASLIRGFTLIEVLVGLAIFALAALLLDETLAVVAGGVYGDAGAVAVGVLVAGVL